MQEKLENVLYIGRRKKQVFLTQNRAQYLGWNHSWRILTFMSDFISLYICYANRIENAKENWYENAT